MTAVFGLGLLPSVLLGPLFQAVADALSATGLP
jgi:hypothetical protein